MALLQIEHTFSVIWHTTSEHAYKEKARMCLEKRLLEKHSFYSVTEDIHAAKDSL